MISSLLIFVSLRARKIVNERSENPYPHSNSVSTRSSVSVGEDPNQSIQAFIKYVDLVFSKRGTAKSLFICDGGPKIAPSGRNDPKFCMHHAFGMLIPKI